MKKFSFRLQPVLKHRETVEKSRQQALSRVLRQAADRRRAIEQRAMELARERDTVSSQLAHGVPARALTLYQDRAESFTRELALLKEELQRVEAQVEKARAELARAAKDRKVVEQLREMALEEFWKEVRKEDDAVADEISVLRHKDKQGK